MSGGVPNFEHVTPTMTFKECHQAALSQAGIYEVSMLALAVSTALELGKGGGLGVFTAKAILAYDLGSAVGGAAACLVVRP